MATRQERRAANKEGSIYSVKTGFKKIFTDARLAATTLQALQLVTPIVIEANILANLHVLRCLEEGGPAVQNAVPKLDQTFYSNCMYAKHPSLAASLNLYKQQLPSSHQQPERPTFIKDVSATWSNAVLS